MEKCQHKYIEQFKYIADKNKPYQNDDIIISFLFRPVTTDPLTNVKIKTVLRFNGSSVRFFFHFGFPDLCPSCQFKGNNYLLYNSYFLISLFRSYSLRGYNDHVT